MSQLPPASGGWTDPYGNVQPGFPPPGYWQASDGRWYPPESRPAEPAPQQVSQPAPFAPPGGGSEAMTQVVNHPYGTPAAPGPSYAPGPTGPPGYGTPQPNPYGAPGYPAGPAPLGFQGGPGPVPPGPTQKSRTGLWIALGVAVLLFAGCGVAVAIAANNGDDTATDPTSSSVPTIGGSTGVTPTSLINNPGLPSVTEGGGFFLGEDGLSDIVSCTRVDPDRIEIDLTNSSTKVVDYYLTVVLEDTPGQRLADTSTFIEAVRPGEHVIEKAYVFEDKGKTCEVIQADRSETGNDQGLEADVSACTITEPDALGDVAATLTVTNSAATNSDYTVTVSLVDDKGIRRGTGYTAIEAVRPGEKAPGDVFTTLVSEGTYTCDVVAVTRSAS